MAMVRAAPYVRDHSLDEVEIVGEKLFYLHREGWIGLML